MDFIEIINDDISYHSINLISQKTGESEERARAGILAAIPAVLAGIMKNGTAGGAGFLSNLLPDQLADKRANVTGTDSTDADSLLDRGKSMLGDLFGEDTDAVATTVSEASGINRQKSAGLLAMVTPIIMGSISRLMSSKGWSFSDLIRKLFENKSKIASSLPGNLGSTFGLASLHVPDETRFVPPVSSHIEPVGNVPYSEPASSGSGFLKWLVPLILIALAAWWLLGRDGNDSAVVNTGDTLSAGADTSALEGAASTVAGSLNAAGDWIYDLGPAVEKKLPDGTTIRIGENSVENRLIGFIEDENRAVDKTTWFSFDRLYFETGKSALKPESKEQLENVAAIMKAYPDVKIKLGGYTDSTGDAGINKRLSNDRAMSAMKELTSLGVPASRMEAEGYGSEHPIASNDTPEGRAQNRRIDIRVTAK